MSILLGESKIPPSSFTKEIKFIAMGNGLVGYWAFDEGSGDKAFDKSGYGNTLTLFNSPAWVTGIYDYALSFNPTTGTYCQNSNLTNNFGLTNVISVSFWVYLNNSPSNRFRFVGTWSQTGNQANWLMWTPSIGSTGVQFYTALGGSPTSSNLSLNTWHHIVGVLDGTTVYLYVDNSLVGTNLESSGSFGTNNIGFWVGAEPDVPDTVNGIIDEVRIYNRALSSTDVDTLFNLTSPFKNPETLIY